MSYSEDQLRQAVDAVFAQYDKDKNGTLESAEVTSLINDALTHMKAGRQASPEEVTALVKNVDANCDGKISKEELLQIFKKVVASNK